MLTTSVRIPPPISPSSSHNRDISLSQSLAYTVLLPPFFLLHPVSLKRFAPVEQNI